MTSLAEMRKELRDMRKETVKPVSRMKKGDIAGEIARFREKRETTPAVAAVPSAPPKKMMSSVESVKEAKAKEFPVAPAKTAKVEAPKKKAGLSKVELLRMIAEMSD
jgi:hypothetical protein